MRHEIFGGEGSDVVDGGDCRHVDDDFSVGDDDFDSVLIVFDDDEDNKDDEDECDSMKVFVMMIAFLMIVFLFSLSLMILSVWTKVKKVGGGKPILMLRGTTLRGTRINSARNS